MSEMQKNKVRAKIAQLAHLAVALIGVWFMAAPVVFGYEQTLAESNDRIVGPLIATFGAIAFAEVTRPLRWVNVVLGLWMIVAPWLLGYESNPAIINSMICGVAAALLSLVKGRLTSPIGGGWRVIWQGETQT